MNGAFCWKESSGHILRECFNNTFPVRDEDDHSSEEEEDDLATTDNSIFEMACANRELALQLRPGLGSDMQQWRELTNINMGRDLSRNNSLSDQNTCVQSHDENGNLTYSPSNFVVEQLSNDEINKNSDKKTKTGQLKIKVQYPFNSERVEVTVAGANDFVKDTMSAKDISVDSEVCLMPGNAQQQVTTLRIGSIHTVLNSAEYFTEHPVQDVHQMHLIIKVNGSGGENGDWETIVESDSVYGGEFGHSV